MTRRHAAGLAALTTVALALAAIPLASGDIVIANDVVAGGSATLPVGNSSAAIIYLLSSNAVPTGDLTGCNAGGAGSGQATRVYLNSSAPSKVAVASPGYVTLEACDNSATTPYEGNQTIGYSVIGGAPGDFVILYANATGGKPPKSGGVSSYLNDTIAITIAAPPNTAPTTPGAPVSDASPTRGAFNLTWTASTDNESSVTYTLEHRDADDAGWSTVATGLAAATYAFTKTSPEDEGTWTYRVSATDGALSSGWSPASDAVKVDRSSPNVPTASADRTAEYAGTWWKDTVTVTFTSNGDSTLPDGSAGSGVASVTAPQTFSTNGSYTASGNATDNVSLRSKDVEFNVSVDATAPDLALWGCPAAPVLRNATVSAPWAAWDNESGLAGNATGSLALPTSTLGAQNATQTVADNVGHQTNATCAYTVIGYAFAGFYAPLSPDGAAWNTAKAGSTVPLKFNVSIGGEFQTGTTYGSDPIVSLAYRKVACPGAAAEDPIDYVTNSTGGTSLRYDAIAQQFVYNWKTPTTKGCYELTMTGLDGTKLVARFSLK